MTRLHEAKSKLVERADDLTEVGLFSPAVLLVLNPVRVLARKLNVEENIKFFLFIISELNKIS